jgi:serine/threonine-protein kinase TTK/MPS1
MIYGSTPFHRINGPMAKLMAIANPKHHIEYPSSSTSATSTSSPEGYTVAVPAAAIASMRGCLEYDKDRRLTIPRLLQHEFLVPTTSSSSGGLPPGATSITADQMAMLVRYIAHEGIGGADAARIGGTAKELFEQLQEQNARSQR